jgi:hypothetical protein
VGGAAPAVHVSRKIAPALRYQHATAGRDQVIAERMEELITGTRVPGVSRSLRSIS